MGKKEQTVENKVADELTIIVPPRTLMIVKQLVIECFDNKTFAKIYHATGRRISTNFTRLNETIVPV